MTSSIGRDFLDALVANRGKGNDSTNYHGDHNPNYVKIVAPMVRYSKLPFRLLCKQWGADLVYTPMIIAEAFNRSERARDSDFSTGDDDQPLIVQFATDKAIELGMAAEKAKPYAQGIEINCGCPQRWAIKDGIGAAMCEKPQLVKEMVWETRKRLGNDFPVLVKIRLRSDMRKTMELVKCAEAAGVAWVTVHGRTVKERRSAVHYDQLQTVKELATVPIIANGDVFTASIMNHVVAETKTDGVMCARGMMANPAMMSGHDRCPLECTQQYLKIALEYGSSTIPYSIHYHHVLFMIGEYLTKADRMEYVGLKSLPSIISFLKRRGLWSASVMHRSNNNNKKDANDDNDNNDDDGDSNERRTRTSSIDDALDVDENRRSMHEELQDFINDADAPTDSSDSADEKVPIYDVNHSR